MSQYFLAKYRPIADALLKSHGLTVPGMTRDMLADTITHNRELPKPDPEPRGSRSFLPALRTARTHAQRLIEYTRYPPARRASVSLRCAKLAAAIRRNQPLVGLHLAVAGLDPNTLLDALDSGHVDVDTLGRLVRVVDTVEAAPGGIGRPWASHTVIIRTGCIVWECAGRRVTCAWNVKSATHNGKLTGALPAFLRDLIACCDGTHRLTSEKRRRIPAGYRLSKPIPRGNLLRLRVHDCTLRDGIYAWQKWRRKT